MILKDFVPSINQTFNQIHPPSKVNGPDKYITLFHEYHESKEDHASVEALHLSINKEQLEEDEVYILRSINLRSEVAKYLSHLGYPIKTSMLAIGGKCTILAFAQDCNSNDADFWVSITQSDLTHIITITNLRP